MSDWIDPAKRRPREGQIVQILLGSGPVNQVLYEAGRFWKVRKGQGGHTYLPLGWKPLEKKGAAHGQETSAAAADGNPEDSDR